MHRSFFLVDSAHSLKQSDRDDIKKLQNVRLEVLRYRDRVVLNFLCFRYVIFEYTHTRSHSHSSYDKEKLDRGFYALRMSQRKRESGTGRGKKKKKKKKQRGRE